MASLQVLLDAADTASVTSQAFVDAVRSVTEASKRAASMYRTVQSSLADGEAFVELHPDLGGHELVLAQLAALYGGPDRAGAELAYRAADRDSSGFLDFRELCGVVKVRVSHPATRCLPLRSSFSFCSCIGQILERMPYLRACQMLFCMFPALAHPSPALTWLAPS